MYRIRFHGQDIMIFREDILNKMRRHCITPPRDNEECSEPTLHVSLTCITVTFTSYWWIPLEPQKHQTLYRANLCFLP